MSTSVSSAGLAAAAVAAAASGATATAKSPLVVMVKPPAVTTPPPPSTRAKQQQQQLTPLPSAPPVFALPQAKAAPPSPPPPTPAVSSPPQAQAPPPPPPPQQQAPHEVPIAQYWAERAAQHNDARKALEALADDIARQFRGYSYTVRKSLPVADRSLPPIRTPEGAEIPRVRNLTEEVRCRRNALPDPFRYTKFVRDSKAIIGETLARALLLAMPCASESRFACSLCRTVVPVDLVGAFLDELPRNYGRPDPALSTQLPEAICTRCLPYEATLPVEMPIDQRASRGGKRVAEEDDSSSTTSGSSSDGSNDEESSENETAPAATGAEAPASSAPSLPPKRAPAKKARCQNAEVKKNTRYANLVREGRCVSCRASVPADFVNPKTQRRYTRCKKCLEESRMCGPHYQPPK